jgi:Uma2 family endonuclease
MSTLATKTLYTPQDLLRMPDGNRYELVDGELVEHNMSFWANYVSGEIYARLRDHGRANNLGWVAPEGTTYQCFPDAPNEVRKADTSFIRLERMTPEQAMEEGHTTIAPDLAVEVVSPNDLAYEVAEKVSEYLTAGVRLVWVISLVPSTCIALPVPVTSSTTKTSFPAKTSSPASGVASASCSRHRRRRSSRNQ